MEHKMKKFIIVTVIIVFALYITELILTSELGDHYLAMDDGWKITINDTTYENVTISKFKFDVVGKGDTLIMEYTLPEVTIENPTLVLYTIHSDISVTMDDNTLYAYGQQLREENKLLGYGYHHIGLQKDYSNQPIKIVMHITENDAFGSLQTPKIYNGLFVEKDFIINHLVSLAVNLFLIVFGLCVIVLTCTLFGFRQQYFRLVCLSLLAIGVSFWSICTYDLITLFTYNKRVKAFLEFGALYTAPIFGLWYFGMQ